MDAPRAAPAVGFKDDGAAQAIRAKSAGVRISPRCGRRPLAGRRARRHDRSAEAGSAGRLPRLWSRRGAGAGLRGVEVRSARSPSRAGAGRSADRDGRLGARLRGPAPVRRASDPATRAVAVAAHSGGRRRRRRGPARGGAGERRPALRGPPRIAGRSPRRSARAPTRASRHAPACFGLVGGRAKGSDERVRVRTLNACWRERSTWLRACHAAAVARAPCA